MCVFSLPCCQESIIGGGGGGGWGGVYQVLDLFIFEQIQNVLYTQEYLNPKVRYLEWSPASFLPYFEMLYLKKNLKSTYRRK